MTNSIGFPMNNPISAQTDMGKKAIVCLEKVRKYEETFISSNQTPADLDDDPRKVRLDSCSKSFISHGQATIGEYGKFKDGVQEMFGSSTETPPSNDAYPVITSYYEKKSTSDGTEFYKVNTDTLTAENFHRVQESIRFTADGYVFYENTDENTERY